jgi:hypothetical protein
VTVEGEQAEDLSPGRRRRGPFGRQAPQRRAAATSMKLAARCEVSELCAREMVTARPFEIGGNPEMDVGQLSAA